MRSVYRLEAYTKVFFLREIVTPGPFPHLHLNGSVFKWDYPESWEKPCSFFSLLFHVKVVRNGEDCHSNNPLDEKNISKTEYPIDPIIIKPKRFVFCLRAQDKHTEGPWSHWILIKSKKNKTKHLTIIFLKLNALHYQKDKIK
uniref:Interleukin 12B n=1 Tax=Periophthalmus magnuspinnatus TaxID=409849 RepID=A0A3B4B2T8_9GOBI